MFRGVKSRPSWYYRVQGLLTDRYHRRENNLCDDDEPRPEDYDEDLSSVFTFSCASRNGCDYVTDDICEYHMKLDTEGPDSDKELDKNDPDDIKYLEMKMDRRCRKRIANTEAMGGRDEGKAREIQRANERGIKRGEEEGTSED